MEKKKSIQWESATDVLGKLSVPKTTTTTTKVSNELDNDAATLEKDRSYFQQLFAKLNPDISVVEIEADDNGVGDRFILNAVSIRYLDAIKALLKDNAVQYEVEDDLHRIPLEGGPSKSYKAIQHTVTIYRRALKKLKRSPSLTIMYSATCLIVIAFFLSLFYRIVLAT